MKKIVLICGLIAGLIAGGWCNLFIHINKDTMDFDGGMVYGYAAMILGFSLIFVGVKNYRDNNLGGYMTFGNAFKVGVLITLVASTIYVAMWLVDYYLFIADFGKHMTAYEVNKLQKAGASAAVIAKKVNEMKGFAEMYKNPFINGLLTYTEILPVGLIVSLIAALILKKKPKADKYCHCIKFELFIYFGGPYH